MREIFIVFWRFNKASGAGRAVVNLANILASQYKTRIICTDSTTGKPDYPLDNRVEIIHLGMGFGINLIGKMRKFITLRRRLPNVLPKGCCAIGTNTPINIVLSQINGIGTIGCEHINYSSCNQFYSILRRLAYRKLNRVVLLTENDQKKYTFLHNTCVIPNSLSFAPVPKNDYTEKNILAIGRLTHQKGFDILLDAAKLLESEHSDWHITIVGEGEDYGSLMEKIEKLKLNNFVRIIEPVSDMISLYHSASIYVMSSRFEGLPMVLIEAQSCGLPIVSFDCPEGPAELIENDKNGFLVPAYDIGLLANKLSILINDIDLREEFGKNAFKQTQQFSTKKIAEMWFNLLERDLYQ